MSENEKKLWNELDRVAFIVSSFTIILLAIVYFVVSLTKPDEGTVLCICRKFALDIVTNLIPVFLLFAGSYALFRRIQSIRSEREVDELVAKILSEIRDVLQKAIEDIDSQRRVDSADLVYGELIDKIPEDVQRYIEFKEKLHTSQVNELESQIKRLEKANETLNRWLETYMPGGREPEEL